MKLWMKAIFTLFVFTLFSCGENTSTLENATVISGGSTTENWLVDQSSGIAKIYSTTTDYGSYYGEGIAVGDYNGDGKKDLAVGAPRSDLSISPSDGQSDSGAVYFYYDIESASTFYIADYYLSSQTDNNNRFGQALYSKDLNNDGYDDLIVGAPYDDRAGSNTGAVYFYYGSSTGISTTPYLVLNHPSSTADASFGSSLTMSDLDGDGNEELIVGAILSDTAINNGGSVWVIAGQANNAFTTTGAVEVYNSGSADSDQCGHGVAVGDHNNDGNKDIYIGCPFDDTGGAGRGLLYVFYGNGTNGTWVTSNTTPDVTITNPAAANNDYFGQSLLFTDYDGDGSSDLIVGVYAADDSFNASGSLYVFSDIQSANTLDVIVGPPYTKSNADYFGIGMALGDVNGDGTNDLLVGSAVGDYSGYGNGRVTSYTGSNSGFDLSTVQKNFYYSYHTSPSVQKNVSDEYLGSAVCYGDMNGDGYDDLIVGAYHSDYKYADNGAIHIFYSRSSGKMYHTPDLTIEPPGSASGTLEFGSSCAVMDYNRDGTVDLLVGAWMDDSAAGNAGAVYVFLGTSSGIATTHSSFFTGPGTTNYGFGSSLAIGDIDNDGYNDIIVGAHLDDSTAADQGAIYVFRSDSTTGIVDVSTSTKFEATGGATLDYLGFSVLAYDYDGDGDKDLLAGAPGDDDNGTDNGMIYVWLNGTNGATAGANTLIETTHDNTIAEPTTAANVGFGSALHGSTYTNTSYPDLFIGSYLNDSGGTDSGLLWKYEGTSTGFNTSPSSLGPYDNALADNAEWLGHAITVFDFNRDGNKDLVVGAPADDEIGVNQGSVYIDIQQ